MNWTIFWFRGITDNRFIWFPLIYAIFSEYNGLSRVYLSLLMKRDVDDSLTSQPWQQIVTQPKFASNASAFRGSYCILSWEDIIDSGELILLQNGRKRYVVLSDNQTF